MKSEHIYLSLAHIGGRELDFIQEAFDTNWVWRYTGLCR